MICVNPKELYDFLERKGIYYLYHANTVSTSCTFFNQGGLLSRGAVERMHLFQTPQDSDSKDIDVGVWDDIFLDVLDLHIKYNRPNNYGPVCFVLSIELLLDEHLPNICITKNNPWYWKTSLENNNYFSSVDEYKTIFDESYNESTIQRKMLTIRGEDYILQFSKYLKTVLLDNPNINIDGINLYDNAFNIIINALINNGYEKNLLQERQCPYPGCYCKYNYKNYWDEEKLIEFFAN